VVLADNLVRVLRAQRSLGGDAYPLAFARLLELTQPRAAKSLLKKAVAQPAFQETVLLAMKNQPESPVALAEDRDLLAASDLLLEKAVQLTRTDADQICTLPRRKKTIHPGLQKPLEEAIHRRIETRSLPPAIGGLRQGKTWVLFLMSDVLSAPPGRPKPAPSPTPAQVPASEPSATFARLFDEAFGQLDRQKGAHNFVSLVELRRVLAVDRQTFDAGLRSLRQAGRYTLSGAEGRHGVSPEEREAGITEDGSLLLYVSRKLS
jgi:hypothetical protein